MKENIYLDYEKKAISKAGNDERQSFGANSVVDPNYAEKQKPGEPPYEQCAQRYPHHLSFAMERRIGVWTAKEAACAFGVDIV